MMTDTGYPRNVPTADAHGCLTRDGVPRLIRREAGVMVTEAPPRADSQVARSYHHRPFGLLKDLERPRDMFRDLGPNWFATVMGTGVVGNAAAILPVHMTGLTGRHRH
jgi:hypothetical protein